MFLKPFVSFLPQLRNLAEDCLFPPGPFSYPLRKKKGDDAGN